MPNDIWHPDGRTIARYRIDLVGGANARNVWLRHNPDQRLDLSPEERLTMDERWRERLARSQRLEDLPLYRLVGWQVHRSRLILQTGLTTYKEFIGTRPGRGANAIAISAVSITSDGHAILNQRAAGVGEYEGLWHVTPAGHPHPPGTIASATWDELGEELDVARAEVEGGSALATGLATNMATGKPEIVLLLRLRLTAAQVLARSAIDSWEYTRLEPLEWSPANVARWLHANVERCVPIGHAALLLAGRIDFGDRWFEERIAALTEA